MLVNITHDTKAEHARLFGAGLAFITVIAILIGMSIAIYNKAFTHFTTVTIKAENAGLQLAQFGDVMRDFLRKYMTWESLKDEYALIYARTFTEPELRELTAFYRSPIGQKVATSLPQLMNEGAELGQRKGMEHMPELQQAILARLQQGGGGSTNP